MSRKARSYSVAEAKDRFTRILRDVERGSSVEVTRRGQAVAALVPISEYRRLVGDALDPWRRYLAWRDRSGLDWRNEDIDGLFAGVRDRTVGRDVALGEQ